MSLYVAIDGEWVKTGGSEEPVEPVPLHLSTKFSDFTSLFEGVEDIEYPPEWPPYSQMVNPNRLFRGCTNLKEITLENFDFSKVTNNTQDFVYGCTSLRRVHIDATSLAPTSPIVSLFQGTSSGLSVQIDNLTLGSSSASRTLRLYKGPDSFSYHSNPSGTWITSEMTAFLNNLPDVSSIVGERVIRFYTSGTQWGRVDESIARANNWKVEYMDANGGPRYQS